MRILAILLLYLPNLAMYAQSTADEKFNQGYSFYKSEKYEAAIEAYSEAIAINPKEEEYYYHRGVCRSLVDDNLTAIVDFTVALDLDPEFAEAYFERAYSYYLTGRDSLAITDYDKAISLYENYAQAYFNRGTVKYGVGDETGACADWKKARSLELYTANGIIDQYCPD